MTAWTPADEARLRRDWQRCSPAAIARKPEYSGRDEIAIRMKALRLGLGPGVRVPKRAWRYCTDMVPGEFQSV